MAPVNPELNWFYRNKENRTVLYDTSEVLADIKTNVSGKLFYKNGLVALEYLKGRGGVYKYVIYSHKIDYKETTPATPTVLGWFDHLGNAVVYDETGEVRIQYNQFEGCVRDNAIGTPCKWKWHNLNDPPTLEDVFTEQYEQVEKRIKNMDKRSIHLDRLRSSSQMSRTSRISAMSTTSRLRFEDEKRIAKREYQAMINLEVITLLKRQKKRVYRRLLIKSKSVGISECWSLNVIDLEHIYLRFRNEGVKITFNLGLKLVSNNVLGLTKVEYSDTLVGVLSVPELMMP